MAVKKIKLPNNAVLDINDSRIAAIDTSLSASSQNVVTNSAISEEFEKVVYLKSVIGSVDPTSGTDTNPIVIGGDENVIEAITFNGTPAIIDSQTKTAAITATIPTVPAISTSISSDATSNDKTASPKAVKDYVDDVLGDIETLLAAI